MAMTDGAFLQSSLPFLFAGPVIHSLSSTELEICADGILVVCGGKVARLMRGSDVDSVRKEFGIKEEDVHILGKEQFLIPGFVDTHIHAPQYPNLGVGYDTPLLRWLEEYTFPLEKSFRDEEFAERVYDAVVRRTIANGTTTASYFATIHRKSSLVLARSAQKYGQRAFVGKVNMVENCPEGYRETVEESVAETEAFVREVLDMNDELVAPIITPRFALSCDMELMTRLGKIARDRHLPIQSHVSENLEEVELVRSEYPTCKNYVDVYDKAGLVTNKTVLAHGIHLGPEEVDVLRERGAAISHCPSSNLLLGSGLCPLRRLLESGVRLALGTDCSGGCSCSVLDALRQAMSSSVHAQFEGRGRKLSLAEAFYLATLAGAEALSVGHKTGNFAVGKDFDAIVVDLKNSATDLFGDHPVEELFQKFIYLGDDRAMARVYVKGVQVKPFRK